MTTQSIFDMKQGPLPIKLMAAVVQGFALYALHRAVELGSWPATNLGWLVALYAMAVFVPLTLQWLWEHDDRRKWTVLILLAVAYGYFGWHYGQRVYTGESKNFLDGNFVEPGFLLGLLWLLVIPFVQARLKTGQWLPAYDVFFTTAWRNKLLLAEAAAFTGIFWLLLLLWQELFKMLGVTFFTELFQEPIFAYPVTSIVFGIALHLIGSVEKLTAAILEQALSVLKWLTLIAGFILAIFTLALLFKLPALLATGEKAIGAAWLLWLVAVTVLLINAAYRDGTIPQPYPQWIGLCLRFVLPLTMVVALTANYALYVRTHHYGLTVERVWALIVAAIALLYAAGYSLAALRKGHWLQGLGRINVFIALTLIAILAATMTPILSPYRLAANSQYGVTLAASAAQPESARSAMAYLRFDAGRYGLARLQALSQLRDHPRAESIRAAAESVQKQKHRGRNLALDAERLIAEITAYPRGRQLDAALRAAIAADLQIPAKATSFGDNPLAGAFADLNGDAVDEFLLFHRYGALVYAQTQGTWRHGANARPESSMPEWQVLASVLEKQAIEATAPKWRDLQVGTQSWRVHDVQD